MKRILILLIVIVIGATFSYAQKQTKAEKAAQLKELIESGNYRFNAQSVTPLSGSKVNLTSLYYLSVEKDLIISDLPYYGRAYNIEYGSTDLGIKFDEKAKTLSTAFNEKKDLYDIEIKVKTQDEDFQIHISAGLNGYATVSIIPGNRQSVSYYGTIEAIPDKD